MSFLPRQAQGQPLHHSYLPLLFQLHYPLIHLRPPLHFLPPESETALRLAELHFLAPKCRSLEPIRQPPALVEQPQYWEFPLPRRLHCLALEQPVHAKLKRLQDGFTQFPQLLLLPADLHPHLPPLVTAQVHLRWRD